MVSASAILFGKSTNEELKSLDEDTFLDIFEGVPKFKLSVEDLKSDFIDLLVIKTSVFSSKGEARRMITANALSINKEKVNLDYKTTKNSLINNKYLLVQKGKKNYYLILFL